MRDQKTWFLLPLAAFLAMVPRSTMSFVLSNTIALHKQRRAIIPKMCICINCARVTDCTAYHFVESKHNQPHMTESPTFEPQDGAPTIHVNIRTVTKEDRQREIDRMFHEHEAETERAKATQNKEDGRLVGTTTYDLGSSTTYEYDVVKCADYTEDLGCWVRNMPEVIRMANPDFVPS